MSDSLKALNQAHYARAGENYVATTVHDTEIGLPEMLELAGTQFDWHVLDVATGDRQTALYFASHVGTVIATDFIGQRTQVAQRFIQEQDITNIKFCSADAEILPFTANSFDLVTCRLAAHHFRDIFTFVQEATRVLKPKGILLVQDHVVSDRGKIANYVNAFEKLCDPTHVCALAEYEWRGIFLDAGLTIEHTGQHIVEHEVQSRAKRQNCSDEIIEQLNIMLLRAPGKVLDWMKPQFAGTEYARYTDHHIIIKGQKPDA